MGIWRTGVEPIGTDGTGEPSRAVEWSRKDAEGELRSESRDDVGTGRDRVEFFPLSGIFAVWGESGGRAGEIGASTMEVRKLELILPGDKQQQGPGAASVYGGGDALCCVLLWLYAVSSHGVVC